MLSPNLQDVGTHNFYDLIWKSERIESPFSNAKHNAVRVLLLIVKKINGNNTYIKNTSKKLEITMHLKYVANKSIDLKQRPQVST